MQYITFLILTFAFAFSISANAGMSSSGGEYLGDNRNPWFIGKQPFSYCISGHDSFSLSKSRVEILIRDSLKEWTKVIEKLKPRPTEFKLKNGNRENISTKYFHSCTNPDLAFHLGDIPQDLQTLYKEKLQRFVAIAARYDMSSESGRAKGVIWFSPDEATFYEGPKRDKLYWLDERVFKTVLLHELGHVFGVGHGNFPFMEENFPAEVVAYPSEAALMLRDPLKFGNPLWQYQTNRWFHLDREFCGMINAGPASIEKVFSKLMGGSSPLNFCLKTKSINRFGDIPEKIYIRVIDKRGRSIKGEFLRKSPSNILPGILISGLYNFDFENFTSPFPLMSHTFVDWYDTNWSGTLTVAGKVHMMNLRYINTGISYFDIDVFADGEFLSSNISLF